MYSQRPYGSVRLGFWATWPNFFLPTFYTYKKSGKLRWLSKQRFRIWLLSARPHRQLRFLITDERCLRPVRRVVLEWSTTTETQRQRRWPCLLKNPSKNYTQRDVISILVFEHKFKDALEQIVCIEMRQSYCFTFKV